MNQFFENSEYLEGDLVSINGSHNLASNRTDVVLIDPPSPF